MTTNKADFLIELTKQIQEPIYLTERTDKLSEEIYHNHWILNVPNDLIPQLTTTDFLEFIQKVKDSYRLQLEKSSIDIDLIFYLWFDEMTGRLNFNFINSNHQNLPFGCKLKYVDRPEEIVEHYLKSKYKDSIIPWNELEDVVRQLDKSGTSRLENESYDNFILNVYNEMIKTK